MIIIIIIIHIFMPCLRFCIFLVIFNFRPANAETLSDTRLWLTYSMDYRLNADLRLLTQLQPYWRDNAHTYDQLTFRQGLYYQLSNTSALGCGYVYNLAHPDSKPNTHERRLWEDWIQQYPAKFDIQFINRVRLEHRMPESSSIIHGLREQLKIVSPLSAHTSLVVSDEVYLNLNDTQQIARGFEQNRLFVGVAYRLGAHETMEFGYTNQFVHANNDANNHIMTFSFSSAY